MSVALRRRWLSVPEKLSDNGQRESGAGANAGVRVSQVMDAQPVEPRRSRDGRPWLLEIMPGLAFLRAGDNVRVAVKARQ